MSTALATRENQQINTYQPAMSIMAVIERRNLMVEFVQKAMVEKVDYGAIPGTTKNTLLKPGAEKLCTLFHLTPKFEIIEKTEDWTGRDHGGEMFFYYLYRCRLYNGDQLIAESDGSCNSFEKKYRWRNADRVCPVCNVAAIRKSANDKGGGWYCWKKINGCGMQYEANDGLIVNQESGKIPNPDMADQVNTILKMAQKRSIVAATLLAVNASEFFTQDMEDQVIETSSYMVEHPNHVMLEEQPKAQSPYSKPTATPKVDPPQPEQPIASTSYKEIISLDDLLQTLPLEYAPLDQKAKDALAKFSLKPNEKVTALLLKLRDQATLSLIHSIDENWQMAKANDVVIPSEDQILPLEEQPLDKLITLYRRSVALVQGL